MHSLAQFRQRTGHRGRSASLLTRSRWVRTGLGTSKLSNFEFWKSQKRKQKKHPRRRRALTVESLESRALFAADVASPNLGPFFNPQHNSAIAADVNADQFVSPQDALLVINLLNRKDELLIAAGEDSPNIYPDVSDDGIVSPQDALIIINELNAHGEPAPPEELAPVECASADSMKDFITACEVKRLLARGAAASASEDAIIAIVDRGGRILGVRTEQGVLAAMPDDLTLVFAIDGAVAKARTAAFFSSGDSDFQATGPLTSRTVRFISQSTITQREVEGNPTVPNPLVDDPFDPLDPVSRTYGPGFVAPIGLGGHFPPGVAFTPPVDLFAIEHQSRDSAVHPGADGIKGTGDDAPLTGRFNAIPFGIGIDPPESFGVQSGLVPHAQSRGIATLPGGIPLYKLIGGVPELVGGIGVFFPGPTGYATHEQGFVPGIGQTTEQRLNAPKVLESEWIAFAAAGGLYPNIIANAPGAVLDGIAPVPGYGLPNGRIDLVGITLEIYGPNPTQANPRTGVETILAVGAAVGRGSNTNGLNQIVDPLAPDPKALDGTVVPEGWLVGPLDSPVPGGPSAEDVSRIIMQGVAEADLVRAAIRLDISQPVPMPGPRTRMVLAVADKDGNVLGIFRMKDATVFSIDVAVAKARNTAYYADFASVVPDDRVDDDLLLARGGLTPAELASFQIATNGVLGSPDLYTDVNSSLLASSLPGIAFTNRTFRFLAEPRYPSGIEGTLPPVFSILNDPGINRSTAENLGAPSPASSFQSVLGFDAFHLGRNFRDPEDIENQNGIIFFPGSSPLYAGGILIGGFGVSGDGVDQDDVVTASGMAGFAPPPNIRVDQVFYRGVRLPFQKFNRNPRR